LLKSIPIPTPLIKASKVASVIIQLY